MRSLPVLLVSILLLVPSLAARADKQPAPTTIDELVAALDLAHESTARLARDLGTLGGRAALLEAAKGAQERWERASRAAIQVSGPISHSRLFEGWETWTEDVSIVQMVVDNLRRNLAGADVLTNDLRTFLDREDAARTLYRVLVRPRHRPFTLQAVLARYFAPADTGRLVVPAAFASAAAEALERDGRVQRALERLRRIGPALRKRLDEWARGWSDVDLDEDEDEGLAVLLHAAGGWSGDPEKAAEAIAAWTATGDVTAGPLPLRAGPCAGDLRETARIARACAARLADDPALDAWRDLLRSRRALLLSPGGRLEQSKPVDVLLNRTGFGRALVTSPEGTVRINPHARWDLDRILVALREDAGETRRLDAALGDDDRAAGTPASEDLLRETASWEAKAQAVEPLTAWTLETLEAAPGGLRVRAGVDPDALHKAAVDLEGLLRGAAAKVVLAPDGLDYGAEGIETLRSSIFYNPRTAYGHYTYVTQFENHHAARLFGTFGWNAKVSQDLADFKRRIRARQAQLQHLAETHDKLIIHMSGVPPWLSSWEGTGTFEGGGWEDKQAHPPKDVAVWKQMIRELALVFREVEGVERYYEFWNEPDLEYWQGSLADFLALYAATVTTIREVDPEGKVGGPAVNQWDGRIHKKTGSDVLVHELIRYAAKHELPLDFVSWHHFGRPVAAIAEAKASYETELERNGFDPDAVEYLVTEWSAPGRGTPYGSPAHAETMLGFFAARIDAQTASCWEEFHAKPDPKGFPPWGLMTQQGDRHGTWYVHRFFDRLARGSRGVAVVRPDAEHVLVVSRKDAGIYDLLLWRTGIEPGLAAALESLKGAKIEQSQLRAFGTTDRFVRALVARGPVPARWPDAFLEACDAYAAADTGPERLRLEVAGAAAVAALLAEAVRTEHAVKPVAVVGGALTCPLARYEVLRLVIRVR